MLIVLTVQRSVVFQDDVWKDCLLDNIGRYVFDADTMYDTNVIYKQLSGYLYRYYVNISEIDIVSMRKTVHEIIATASKAVPYTSFRLKGVQKKNTTMTFRVEDCS